MLIVVETSRFRRTTKCHVRRALKWINQEDLKGLHAIRVMDERTDDPEYAKRPRYLSGFVYKGHYESKTKDRDARIGLFTNDIYFGIPHPLISSPAATLRLARTLAHEVGHHVVETKGYIYRPWENYKPWTGVIDPYEEKMVEAYADDVIERMLRHRPYKFGDFLIRRFANLLYTTGLQKYRDGDYLRAARLGFCAYNLDPTNLHANQCYRHAMEKLKTQTPSPISETEREWLLNRYDGNPQATLREWYLNQAIEKGRRKKKRR